MKKITLVLVMLSSFCQAQKLPFKNLVFEGAGIRGIAYAGVLEEFEKAHLLDSVKRVGGTSAGAIIALTISLGYHSNEISEMISNTNFGKFNDGEYIFFGGIHRMNRNYGWYKGNKFEKWLKRIIEQKTGNGDITFEALHQAGFKDLYVTATCLNKQKLKVFSYITYPHMKVKDAIRISMSIPLYFEAVFIDSLGKVYKNPKNRDDLDIVVDGGIVGNYPIGIFDTVVVDANNNPMRKPNPETLGIRIDSESQIENDKYIRSLTPIKINGFKSYIQAFYIFVIENLNRNQLIHEDWSRTISVSSENIGPKVKKLSEKQKQLLIASGRRSVQLYLKEKK